MNKLFYDIEPPAPVKTVSTAYVENPETNTIAWVDTPSGRVGIVPELTLQDRRELAKTPLKDEIYFFKAKRVYAAGGKAKEIRKECGRSPSYAEKVYAAFNRANTITVKNQY